MWSLEEQIDLLFEQAVGPLQRGGLLPAEEVVAGEVGKHARADSGFSVGVTGDATCGCTGAVVLRRSGLCLKAEAVGERPTAGFNGLQEDGLAGCFAGGILDRGVHLIEERQLVEISLRVEQRGLVERIAGVQRDGALDHTRPRVMKAGDEHIAHKYLRAFIDVKGDVDLAGVVRFLAAPPPRHSPARSRGSGTQ